VTRRGATPLAGESRQGERHNLAGECGRFAARSACAERRTKAP